MTLTRVMTLTPTRPMKTINPERHIEFPKFHSAQKAIYRNLAPRSVLRCGRRFGKTTLLETVAGNNGRKGQYVGWFSPNYKLLSPSYKRILRMMAPITQHASKTEAMIELKTGGHIEFWTLNDEDAGRSRSYDLVIIDEGSLVKTGLKDIWEQSIAPTLLDRRGRAIIAGTPKGIDPDNFFYEVCTNKELGWKEFFQPTRTNPLLDPVGVEALVHDYPPLVYQQEFLAEFVDWSGASFFDISKWLEAGKAVAYPKVCDAVFAVIDTATKSGKEHDGTAVTYYAVSKFTGVPLTILDYDIVQIEGALLEIWLPTVFKRLEELAKQCRARAGSLGTWIEDAQAGAVLLQQSARHGWPAQAIPSGLTSMGKDGRAINVSGYHHRGQVKISEFAHDKVVQFKGQSRNHLLTQVGGFHIGDKQAATRADDLLDTYTYGVALALGDYKGN